MAMDPNPKTHPILSYVMNRLPSMGGGSAAANATATADIENRPATGKLDPSSSSSTSVEMREIVTQMPHLAHPEVLASMTKAISDVAQTRSVLRTLGRRPDHETVDKARAKLVGIEASLSESFEEIELSSDDANVVEKEKKRREAVEEEKKLYKSILQLDELHEAYGKLLKEAEERLVRIYESAEVDPSEGPSKEKDPPQEVNEEVVQILQQASGQPLERVDLSGKKLSLLPEAFGRIQGLRVLKLSNNQLEAIPDSISGLQDLEELDLSINLLESLPDSIGLLSKLKILNVSANKLVALPDSISHCGSLVILDASFNRLTYLPTNIGFELVKLEKLLIHLNKIRSLPTSICEMRSLRHLDAHFNELNGLPISFGLLYNLEFLDLSSNFSDLRELPDTFGDLVSLQELDLSNNQIHALPNTFGGLESLTKLKLDQNPLVIPPEDVTKEGVEAVKTYMVKRLADILEEEKKKNLVEEDLDANAGWLTRTTSKLKTYVSGVSGYLGPKTPTDPYLDQEL